eukprot:3290835-Pleurochrysis_carterae.AAC.1
MALPSRVGWEETYSHHHHSLHSNTSGIQHLLPLQLPCPSTAAAHNDESHSSKEQSTCCSQTSRSVQEPTPTDQRGQRERSIGREHAF